MIPSLAGVDPAPKLTGRGAARLAASDMRIVLTGASGWLGLATLELLRNTLGAEAFEARVRCFGSSRKTLRLRSADMVQQPLQDIAALPTRDTLLIHSAFLTKDKADAMDDDAYVAANAAIRETVAGALDPIGVRALFVPSSGAARVADDDAGATKAMRLYGSLKREDEQRFADWANAAEGRTAVIARVFNLSGPYINKPEHYALAGFILEALAGRAIDVRAPRRVVRSYVAIRELMSVVFGLLTAGDQPIYRFDTAGEDVLEMAEIARAVADTVAPVTVRRAALNDAAADDYVGDGRLYRQLREAQDVPSVGFDTQIRETAAFLAEGP